jgi:hypothetical protein
MPKLQNRTDDFPQAELWIIADEDEFWDEDEVSPSGDFEDEAEE